MDEAISYLRWSTPEQSWGNSDQRQIEWANSWCEKNGCRLAEVYRDSGMSAFHGKNRSHGALGEFLEAVRSGRLRPKYLIVENLDRLSRNDPFEAFDLLREIVKSGITLVTRSQEYNTDEFRKNPYILQQALGEMIRAHSESQRKSEMLASAHAEKRNLAREKKVPITSLCPSWLRLEGEGRREDKKFVIIPEITDIVNRIFNECIAGLGLRSICNRLNKDGIPAFRGKNGWHRSSVTSIITNRAVLGYFQPHKRVINGKRQPDGEPIPDFYPAIIDEHRFAQAQMAMGSRQWQGGRNGPSYSNLVSRLGVCETCGRRVVIRDRGPSDEQKALMCSGRLRGACTNKGFFPYRRLEQMLLALDDLTNAVAHVIPASPPANSASAQLAQLTADIEIAKHNLRELITQFSKHPIGAIRDAATHEIESQGSVIQRMERQQEDLRYQVKATDQTGARSLLARVQEAKRQVTAEDEDTRFLARATVTQEFRRVIARLVLHEPATPRDHRLTLRIKRQTGTEWVEYELQPDRVSSIRLISKRDNTVIHGPPEGPVLLVGPDGQTISIGPQLGEFFDYLGLSDDDRVKLFLGHEVNKFKLVRQGRIIGDDDPIDGSPPAKLIPITPQIFGKTKWDWE